jgi:sigma-B regulation protein RsbU (phosphoserine phosphatase)
MLKVLVADDHAEIRALVRVSLRDEDCLVLEAEDGEQALELARRQKPALIISDIMMPGLDGYEMLARLRKEEGLCDIPVLMLTAREQTNDVVQALDLGAVDYLKKPFAPAELSARVRSQVRMQLARQAVHSRDERRSRELDQALRFQQRLQPSRAAQQQLEKLGYRCFLFSRPASELGGDLVQMQELPPSRFALTVADSKGHGVSAAMLSVAAYSLSQELSFFHTRAGQSLTELNRKLRKTSTAPELIVAVHLLLDERGRVSMSRAGLPYPILCRPGSSSAEMVSAGGGPPLLLVESDYSDTWLELAPGDKLVLYSDGFSEALGPGGEMFGEYDERLLELAAEHGGQSAENLGVALVQAWEAFVSGGQEDDVTVVVLEREERGHG